MFVVVGGCWFTYPYESMSTDYPTLFDVEPRAVPIMPEQMKGKIGTGCQYTTTRPREWTDEEIAWLRDLKGRGYTLQEIATSMGRTLTSVRIKSKRLGKTTEQYNSGHRAEKYAANAQYLETYKPQSVLDAYCGTEQWWRNHVKSDMVISNDADKTISADYNLPAEKLVAKLYAEGNSFDLIDLDPFGSAYDCFDLALRMARKGLIVTFGEIGHKRWKRLDFVRRYYGIERMQDFTTDRLIAEVQRIGRRHKKECVPVIVREWSRISRVYFVIQPLKITEQWEK